MKKFVCLLLLALFCVGGTLGLSASAADILSDGLAVMAEKCEMVKGGIAGSTVRFSSTDFKQAMGLRRFKGITVTSLPKEEEGTLYFGETAVSAPVTVPHDSLASLTFVPKNASVKEASFTFTCDKYAGGSETRCVIRFAEKKNGAPTVTDVAASHTVSTFSGLLSEGTLCAQDPEGDALEFLILEYPKHGVLTVEDAARGDFSYMPVGSYVGKDSFRFVVRDSYGNYSSPATVKVTVKPKTELVYEDLLGSAVSLPAIALSEENIMLGTLVGDGMYFSPDEPMTRGEFLVMAMKAVGIAPRRGLTQTVFDDNEKIPVGIRPYVAKAQEAGYIVGSFGEDGLVFSAEETVTRGEAAVLVSTLLSLKVPVGATPEPEHTGITLRTREATLALTAAGIYPRTEEGLLEVGKPLTRGAAAEMLYATLLFCR